jgi:hypothetical protein
LATSNPLPSQNENCWVHDQSGSITCVALPNCKDPAREAEFNLWYEDIHVADILETGAFHTIYRYESVDHQATQATYLALYETDQSDPAKVREALGQVRADWEKRGRLSDTIAVVASLTARRLWPLY